MQVFIADLAKRLDLPETSSEDEVRAALKPATNEITEFARFMEAHFGDVNQQAVEQWLLAPRPLNRPAADRTSGRPSRSASLAAMSSGESHSDLRAAAGRRSVRR